MKNAGIKKINQTFSIPQDISKDLHTYVKRQEMSKFVAEAIRKELELKKEELRKAYSKANHDPGQKEVEQQWQSTVSDGLDD